MIELRIEIKEYQNDYGSWVCPVFKCCDCPNYSEGSMDPHRITVPPGGWRIYRDGKVRCQYCVKRKKEIEDARTQ